MDTGGEAAAKHSPMATARHQPKPVSLHIHRCMGLLQNGMQHGLSEAGMQHGLSEAGMQHGLPEAGMQHGPSEAGMQHGLLPRIHRPWLRSRWGARPS